MRAKRIYSTIGAIVRRQKKPTIRIMGGIGNKTKKRRVAGSLGRGWQRGTEPEDEI